MPTARRSRVVTRTVLLAATLSLAACGKDAEKAGPADSSGGGGNAQGAAVFKLHCATCHGESGKGDGIGAAALAVKPRDLTSEPYKYVDVAGSASELEALKSYIKVGRLESGMPAYGAILNEADLGAVAEHVLSLRPKTPGG
ncbi:MAG TPA: cytochrome c [Phycisphaerales bacterium]|nr:cytochrome c [Phycisphaerales bacterium]